MALAQWRHDRTFAVDRAGVTIAVAFALDPRFAQRLFPDERLKRLEPGIRVLSVEPITDFHDAARADELAEVEMLITGWGCATIDRAALERMPRLRWIAHAAGTVKGHLSDEVWRRGIQVSSATRANAIPVAEYTVAMILLAGKQAFRLAADLHATRAAVAPDERYPTMGNYGKRVGLIGASTIGRLVIEYLRPFELEVVIADPFLAETDAAHLGVRLMELDELLATSDVVSVHAPELPTTRNMIDARRVDLMRPGTTFVNTARGSLVDHDALRRRARAGELFLILDVTDPEPLSPDDPLYDTPDVLLTPHIAGSLGTELGRLAMTAISEANRIARGLPFEHAVDARSLGLRA